MTPQQLKAMKQALEALELINIEFICRNGSHHKKEDRHEWDEDCPITNRWRKAITAIKEALAEHAMREVQRIGQEIEPKIGCVNHDCDQCKAQTEQEPVACMVENDDYGVMVWPIEHINEAGTYCEENEFPILLYTTPPQRTEQEPVAWHTNSPSDPEICNEQSAQACGPVYCGDSGGYCNKCPKQKIIQAVKPCKGMNCGCTDGRSHSLECLAELAAAIAGGVFVQEALKEKNT